MQIHYKTNKLKRQCEERHLGIQAWGPQVAGKVRQRVAELTSAVCLQQISKLPPQRCHGLHANREGQLSVDVSQNQRLIFEPNHAPIPTLPTGGLDWSLVTQIIIMEVTDYHGD